MQSSKSAQPTVFVASSSEAWKNGCAPTAVKVLKQGGANAIGWYNLEDFKKGSKTTFDVLTTKARTFDLALFIFTAEDRVTIRNATLQSPRDNVLFEFGLFLGAIKNDNVFAIFEANNKADKTQIRLASDLIGVSCGTFKLVRSQTGKKPKIDDKERESIKKSLSQMIGSVHRYMRLSNTACVDAKKFNPNLIHTPQRLQRGLREIVTNIHNEHDKWFGIEMENKHEPFASYAAQITIKRCLLELSNMPKEYIIPRMDKQYWMPWAEARFKDIQYSFRAVSFAKKASFWFTDDGRNYLRQNAEAIKAAQNLGKKIDFRRIFIYRDPNELNNNDRSFLKRALLVHLRRGLPVYLAQYDEPIDDFAIFDGEYLQIWHSKIDPVTGKSEIESVSWEIKTPKVASMDSIWSKLMDKAQRRVSCSNIIGKLKKASLVV